MKRTACVVIALFFAVPAFAQKDDFILKAMRDEMQRSKTLRLPGLDAPYYTEYLIEDADMLLISATLGALISETHAPLRVQSVKVRVGDYKFDSENYVFSEAFGGSRYDPEQLPLETNYPGLRHILWLATDRAFKTAEEGIARKRSALKNVNLPEALRRLHKDSTGTSAVARGSQRPGRWHLEKKDGQSFRYLHFLSSRPDFRGRVSVRAVQRLFREFRRERNSGGRRCQLFSNPRACTG